MIKEAMDMRKIPKKIVPLVLVKSRQNFIFLISDHSFLDYGAVTVVLDIQKIIYFVDFLSDFKMIWNAVADLQKQTRYEDINFFHKES